MPLRRSTLAIAAVAVAALGLTSLGLYRIVRAKSQQQASEMAAVSRTAAMTNSRPSDATASSNIPTLYFAQDPESVPPFLVRDLLGGIVSTAALKGKVLLLNFWATWCGPCREEIPELIALQAQYKNQLQIIGISEDEAPPAEVAQFVKREGINYPVLMSSPALEREYGGIAALPTSFFVSPKGQVVAKDVGVYPAAYYEMQVRALAGLPVNAHIQTFKDTGQIFLKNAAHATELPGVSFKGLTPAQKRAALKELNSKTCTCGCQLTLAECRINDTTCPISGKLAMRIVRAIEHSGGRAPATPIKSSGSR